MQRVAIVGAGFCGSMLSVHLLTRLATVRCPAEILLFERSGRFTAGVAYGTRSLTHLLNVPAGRMSAWPDDPEHFLRWARRQNPRVSGGAFVERWMYGRYLSDLLAEAEAAARGVVALQRIAAEVVALEPAGAGLRLTLAGGSTLTADLGVLAIGNYPPGNPPLADPHFFKRPEYVRDPWSPAALDAPLDQPILLLGTGLTMLDLVLALRERGHSAVVHAVSRRGLLPQPHRVSVRPPPVYPQPADVASWPPTVRGMLRALRAEVRLAAARGINWREVVTSLRSATPQLWRRLPQEERRRFLRHVRPFWETHRHRAAPETATHIAELIQRRELVVHAGRLCSASAGPAGVTAEILRRDGSTLRLTVGRVVNCTGPEANIRRVSDPLIVQMREHGLIRPDDLGLGLESTNDGAILDREGRPSERLFLVGPLRKGLLWENTAVPELRVEVAHLAERLVQRLLANSEHPEPGGSWMS